MATGVTETVAAAHEEVSKVAQLYLQQESKLMGITTDYSSLAVKGASAIKAPRAAGFTVGDKAENTAVTAQTSAFSSDTISLDQHRTVQFLIEDIAEAQANVNVLQEYVLRASKDLALDIDEKIIAELRLASASAPDHQIQFSDTVNEDLALADILEMRRLLAAQNIDPRECYLLVGPTAESQMLAISDFIDASKYGSNEPIQNGEIGKVYGMRVILHTSVGTGDNEAFAFHPTAVGWALQQQIRVQSDMDLANLAMRYSLDYIGGFEVLDAGVRNVYMTETP